MLVDNYIAYATFLLAETIPTYNMKQASWYSGRSPIRDYTEDTSIIVLTVHFEDIALTQFNSVL